MTNLAPIHELSFFDRIFNPYRPELHYMRGPGPACRAKQEGLARAAETAIRWRRRRKPLWSQNMRSPT